VHPILETPNFPQILVKAAATGTKLQRRRNCNNDGRGAVVAIWLKCSAKGLWLKCSGKRL